MPAPKRPNTEPATRKAKERAHERRLLAAADQLRKAGWTVIPPRQPSHDELPTTNYGGRKPYVVADNLNDLRGPTDGGVSLPHDLNWSGDPTYDLDDPQQLASLYRVVLAEANTVEHLNTWLNHERLRTLWPDLYLHPTLRRAWEQRFPDLSPPHQET